jgi:hypothetical protein
MDMTLRWLWIGLLTAESAAGAVLRVPSDYATIQAALDSLAAGDTVLVAAGTYAEVLNAPCLPFTLRGEVPTDSSLDRLPQIDPSLVDTSSPGLTLCGEDPTVVEWIEFHNHRQSWGFGGIQQSGLDSLTVANCKFDSAGVDIVLSERATPLTLTRCVFNDTYGHTAWVISLSPYSSGRLNVKECEFRGGSGDGPFIYCGDSSRVERSVFRDVQRSVMVEASGIGISITGCTFGPSDQCGCGLSVAGTSGRIIGNVFARLSRMPIVLSVSRACSPDTVLNITGNTFYNNMAGTQIEVQCGGSGTGTAVISDNVFDSCRVWNDTLFFQQAVSLFNGASLMRNTFRQLSSMTRAAIRTHDSATVLNWSRFIDTRVALDDAIADSSLDARYNWWGDSTGPHEPLRNPQGRGAEIIGVGCPIIAPWLTDSILPESNVPLRTPVARSLFLEVYPNPFNSQTRIRLIVNEPGVYRADLYNLLGQEIKRLYEGPIAGEKTITLDAADLKLSSGIYWVRMCDSQRHRAAIAKVLLLK